MVQAQITDLLLRMRGGEADAAEQLYSAVYEPMRRIAHYQLQLERPGHTLQTSGLVHETYLRLVDASQVEWQDRRHFYRVAASVMRRVLIDYARRHRAARRGGGVPLLELDADIALAERGDLLLALDEALQRLADLSPRLAQVVECRYFAGLTEGETAEALGVTTRTVQRDWAKAKGWLHVELQR